MVLFGFFSFFLVSIVFFLVTRELGACISCAWVLFFFAFCFFAKGRGGRKWNEAEGEY